MADFKQAIEWLKEGKRVRRKGFCESFANWILIDGKIVYDSFNTPITLLLKDFEEEDWEINESK